nr:hypothetical protein [Tanacetum cinerariifolium]
MIAYLKKSDASEGFNQIIDFFWTTVAVKKVDDVTKLQALVDKKKVVVTEATITDALRLDDADEPSIPSPTPPTPPPQPSQDIPSTSQDAGLPMDLLQNLLDACTTLTRKFEHLEQDKIAQALEITKLKQRVKKLERRNKGMTIADMDADADVVLEEAKDVAANAKDGQDADEKESEPAKLQKVVDIVTTAKIITEVVTAASTTITTADVPIPAATTIVALTLTAAPKSTTTTSIIIHSETKSKDKGKGILVEKPKPLKKQAQIKQDEKYTRELEAELNKTKDWDEVIDHVNKKSKEDKSIKRYQALKRKPYTKAQARKNMMICLKNVAGFKMDYFKGMSYDDVRYKEKIDEDESRALKKINETLAEKVAKRQKLDEEVEELKRHLQIVPNEEDGVYTEATPLARKVPVVDYEIYNQNNKPYYKIKRADDNHIYYNTADFVSREE